ncbi:uncharacterized protein LOC143526584 [Brachyhypopomus gauderio]|uniref:uncharacterized protein LOC143526584 n=1 Tax=Brachyhypopomus gauderio TaxID=698409 RepID=UPI004042603A
MCHMRITQVWIFIITLYKTSLCQTVGLYQKTAVVSAMLGEAVNLTCTFEKHMSSDKMVWYKQKSGQRFQEVGLKLANKDYIILPEFNKTGIKMEISESNISLCFSNVTNDDEGMYFCGVYVVNVITFSTGTFLAVTGHAELNISVVQSPEVERVPPGESVSLQCSVLSERRTAELQVFWFRSSAGDSHPEIISTHHNSSRQCEISSSPHSCVYNLSKSVLSVSDTGTYYCAVLTCGKILLGNGTTVGLTSPVDAVLMMVGAALGVCVLVISAQAVLICRRRNCEHCSVRLQQGAMETKITSQDHDPVELNYAAFHFSKRKPRRGQEKRGQEKRGQLEHSVYSEVLNSTATD